MLNIIHTLMYTILIVQYNKHDMYNIYTHYKYNIYTHFMYKIHTPTLATAGAPCNIH